MCDLGLGLSAVALARGLKLAGAETITTYREDGQTADGTAPEPSEEQRQIAVWRHPHARRGPALLLRRSAHWIARFNEADARSVPCRSSLSRSHPHGAHVS